MKLCLWGGGGPIAEKAEEGHDMQHVRSLMSPNRASRSDARPRRGLTESQRPTIMLGSGEGGFDV